MADETQTSDFPAYTAPQSFHSDAVQPDHLHHAAAAIETPTFGGNHAASPSGAMESMPAASQQVVNDADSTHLGTSINESNAFLTSDDIHIPDSVDDNDSALGSDSLLDMDTESLQSDIKRHCYENGRRYHSYHDGAYWGPNDEIQNDENDISHHLWRLTLDDRLFLAPIGDQPQV